MKFNEQQLKIFAWVLTVSVAGLAFWVWGDLYSWKLSSLSIYQIFPGFGLLAFSIMWAHYIVAAVRQASGLGKEATSFYFEATSLIVLAAILLHPGLLTWQLLSNGFGWPPLSYFEYRPTLKLPIILGEVALLSFLAYEFRRWFSGKSWWPYIQYLSDAAMLLIFYHGLKLGSHLRSGWFRGVWLFYGATLVAALIYIYSAKLSPKRS